MIRLDMRSELRTRLDVEIRFYNQYDDLLTAAGIARGVLLSFPDFKKGSKDQRGQEFEGYMDKVSKGLIYPEPFLRYDTACAHVVAVAENVFALGRMNQGVMPINGLSYHARHASIRGYSPFCEGEGSGENTGPLIAGFQIEDDVIPSRLLPHLATLSPDKSRLDALEQVFEITLRPQRQIKRKGLAFCAYGRAEADELFEDIRYQRDSA